MALANGRAPVGTTATRIIPANTARPTYVLRNTGASSVFVGAGNVTTDNGYELVSGGTLTLTDTDNDLSDEIHAVATLAGNTVHCLAY